MTNKELIIALLQFPLEAEVWIDHDDDKASMYGSVLTVSDANPAGEPAGNPIIKVTIPND